MVCGVWCGVVWCGVVTIIIKIEISTLAAEVVLALLATVMRMGGREGGREGEGEGSELCCENDISSQDSRTATDQTG